MMDRVREIVEQLCRVVPDRRPGSSGNGDAVDYVARRFREAGWDVSLSEFACLDWVGGEGEVTIGAESVRLVPSPYGLGVDAAGPVRIATRKQDLSSGDIGDSVLVVAGDLVSEPLTPKAYPFYGSDEHTAIIEALEVAQPIAIVSVTGKHPALCGALDPFPWIEDGDFEIPAAAVRPSDAGVLLESEGKRAGISIEARRIPSNARNVVARRGPSDRRLVVCAHIDTKPGTPGAVDNAAGVAALVTLADQLGHDRELSVGVELLAVNGEDHFAAPGEVAWLEANEGRLDTIELFINIDGAGYREGATAFSFYNVDPQRADTTREAFTRFDDLVEGPQWFQSDHAIFAMGGRPALAFTTELVKEMLAELFHADTDTPDHIEPARIVNIATAMETLITDW